MARAFAIAALIVSAACSDGSSDRRFIDGGRFEIPDSGFTFDARPSLDAQVAPIDAGPYVCDEVCPDGSVCGCIDTRPTPTCGCNPRQGYTGPCDPQVAETCRWPYTCARARMTDGIRHLCSDGREGTPCAPSEDSCNTMNGCVCLQTPIGLGCSCQGYPGDNPLLCDPRVPASCPEGACVHVDGPNGGTNICSGGEVNEPCNPGDGTCRTSLGCTCPLHASRESCRCSEPGTVPGDPCDPRVEGSCTAPLECVVVRDRSVNQYVSECAQPPNRFDGGTDPLACDPRQPFCPTGYFCTEVRPGTFRCAPST